MFDETVTVNADNDVRVQTWAPAGGMGYFLCDLAINTSSTTLDANELDSLIATLIEARKDMDV